MNHLKKFNEGMETQSTEKLYQACQDTFAELIDDKNINIEVNGKWAIISIDFRKTNISSIMTDVNVHKWDQDIGDYIQTGDLNFNKYLKSTSEFMEIIKDLDVGIKRLKDEFSNLSFLIKKDMTYYRLDIYITNQ